MGRIGSRSPSPLPSAGGAAPIAPPTAGCEACERNARGDADPTGPAGWRVRKLAAGWQARAFAAPRAKCAAAWAQVAEALAARGGTEAYVTVLFVFFPFDAAAGTARGLPVVAVRRECSSRRSHSSGRSARSGFRRLIVSVGGSLRTTPSWSVIACCRQPWMPLKRPHLGSVWLRRRCLRGFGVSASYPWRSLSPSRPTALLP